VRVLSIVQRLSLKSKLIASYLVILGLGGLATSLVGSWIVSNTIMRQAQRTAQHNLATARAVFDQQLETHRQTVALAAKGSSIRHLLQSGWLDTLSALLDDIRRDAGFDFLNLTDARGRVIVRALAQDRTGDSVTAIRVVDAALAGQPAAAVEILSAVQLALESPPLAHQAEVRVLPTPRARPPDRTKETAGMVLMGAAPVLEDDGALVGTLYGGTLLNRNLAIVDRIWQILYADEQYKGQSVGSATIFQGDLRIATTVETAAGERAIGTRVSEEVRAAIFSRGESWNDRAFVVRDWYISSYEPIRDYEGTIIGILYVGLLEKRYTSLRNGVIASFFGIATVGFLAIIGITYLNVRSITQPIGEMVAATRDIAAGRFDGTLSATSQDEIGHLAHSFNTMLGSLRQMKRDLEEWGRTLESKVRERTDELALMQARVAQSERLASVGMLSAGVAHEINNPLGGILSLTALTLEDLTDDTPQRANLEEVVRQAERCREIVRGLLDFSRQSAVSAEPVDMNEVIGSTLALLDKQASFFNITVSKDFADSLPPVLADRSELQQVFLNIIVNAVQAMDERGALSITSQQSPDGAVEVHVSDTGRGIPPDEIDHIFDPFFSSAPGAKGTGLGLSIAYGIVTKHRGTVSVASEVGRGTIFTVRFPPAPAYAAAEQQ